MGSNIADWMEHWDHFNTDLYIACLIAKQNEIQEKKDQQ